MFVPIMITILSTVGVIALAIGIKIILVDAKLEGVVTILFGLFLIVWGLYPFYGDFYVCEYVPAGDDTYTEECTEWEM